MHKVIISFIFLTSLFVATVEAEPAQKTKREPQISNERVEVWKTIIYPSAQQILAMHRHEHDRVLIALTDGVLKVTNQHGQVHYLRLQKDKAYFLKKDLPHELHTDENISKHPIRVIVIELKK